MFRYLFSSYLNPSRASESSYASMDWLGNIDSDNGLSPGRRQAVARTNADVLLAGPLGTHFSETLIIFFVKIRHIKILSSKWYTFLFRPQYDYIQLAEIMNQYFNHNPHAKPTADVKDD